jgi:ABC transporter substrate-binding protein (ThiB subfamily)
MTTPTGAKALPDRSRPSRRRAGGGSRAVVAITIAVVVVLAGYATYAYLQSRPSGTQLVIYTYDSLFNGNCGVSPNLSAVLAPFEAAHDVQIEFQCPSGTLVSTLLAQKSAPRADLVLGLDEVTAPEAEANGLLVPYLAPGLSNVDPNVTAELGTAGDVTPYEWGYLGIDYNTSWDSATRAGIGGSSFPSFAENLSLAHQLVVEDPATDITGEEFLLWEIEFYETVLHQDWQGWWQAVDPSLQYAPDWSTASEEFDAGPGAPSMFVSYTCDPAYYASYGGAGQVNSTVATWNGTEYGWQTVYGVGIVAGTQHLSLDQQFIDWWLGGTVQSAIPLNEWEYPANGTVPLPPVFSANPDPAQIVPLDNRISPAQIALDLPGYLETWQSIDDSSG